MSDRVRRPLMLCGAVVACVFSVTQLRPVQAAMPPVMVQSDRIVIGEPDFVPRFLDLPKVLVINPGTVVEAPADSTWDYVEVGGRFTCSRTHDTLLKVTHLFILPGGVFECGTEANPVPAERHVEIVIRDVPIDTRRDPFEWGNGLVNFGRQSRVGATKLAWSPLTGDVPAGARTVTLGADPVGWRVGDELLFPDTRQAPIVESRPQSPRREAPIAVAAIAGRTITLSKPLDFEHLAQRDPDGAVILNPRVANLTRNIVIRSENPKGTPGHTADVGHDAMWDVRDNALVGLGRTRAQPLDSARLADAHVGTNQIGRYADHHHHAMGFGSLSIGNVLRGAGITGGKWGLAIHGTHDATIEDNIAIDFAGAGFITEDGYETRNAFRHNFAAYVLGNHDGTLGPADDVTTDNPGSEGAGFWFRGIQNLIEENEAWNNSTGMNFMQRGQVNQRFPSKPGGEPDTPFNLVTAKPVSLDRNVTASNTFYGLEYWHISKFPANNHVMSYNGVGQFTLGISGPAQSYFVNPTVICQGGTSGGFAQGIAYNEQLEIDGGGHVEGCSYGVSGGGNRLVRLAGTTANPLVMRNAVDVNLEIVPMEVGFENVLFLPLAGYPAQYIIFGSADIWSGTGPLPNGNIRPFGFDRTIRNWQGSGRNYRLYERSQRAAAPAWPADENQTNGTPDAGLTMGESFEEYGIALNGEVVSASEEVVLSGLINGVAKEGLDRKQGPPRCVVTFPTPRAGAIIEKGLGFIWVYSSMTGNPAGTGSACRVSVDGQTPFLVFPQGDEPAQRSIRTFGSRGTSEGTHTVRTWRVDVGLNPIASSELLFSYVVGPATAPDVPPPPPPDPPAAPPEAPAPPVPPKPPVQPAPPQPPKPSPNPPHPAPNPSPPPAQ
jgi:hypothetical protein